MSDNDEGIFLTQNTYSQELVTDSYLVDSLLDMEEEYPTFNVNSDIFSDISEFESADEDALVKATQEAEIKFASDRFGPVLSKAELNELVHSAMPKNTVNKAKWAIKTFESWRKCRNDCKLEFPRGLLEMSNDEIDTILSFFIAEVKNQTGGDYQPKTLYEMIIALQYHIRYNGRLVNFLEDSSFSGMRRVLDAKMKQLSKKGLGVNRKQAEIIGVDQENELWRKGILGTDTPQKLLDTLLYSIGLNFALRAGQEHRNLRVGPNSQVTLVSNVSEARRYLLYTEDVSKTNSGGLLHRKVEQKTTRAYDNPSCQERCIVKIYEKYMSKRPVGGKSSAFYLRPKKKFTDVWYDDIPVGIHTLATTVGRLCKEGGFVGHYTNHSLRASAATRLYAAGVDEQLISEKTGHRSNAVRSYKRTSEEQQEEVSSIVQSTKKPRKQSVTNENEKNDRELNLKFDGVTVNIKF